MSKKDLFLEKFPRAKRNMPLAPLTTYRIGGVADIFLATDKEEIVVKAVREARKLKIKWFLLGGGSNVVFADKGFRGFIIKIKDTPIVVKNGKIIAMSGCDLQKVVRRAQKESLAGLEFAIGIPGTLGGAIYGNAGAWGQSMDKILDSARVLDPDGKVRTWEAKDFRFVYRSSRLKEERHIILSAILKLKKGEQKEITAKMKKNLAGRGHLPKEYSAGCIFQNIIATPEMVKRFPPEAIKYGKIPTGWLVEHLGLKGEKSGDAFISRDHGNFILNSGRARATDIIRLKELIKRKVREKFDIELKEEVEFW